MDDITQVEIEAVKVLTDQELTGLFHLLHDHDIGYITNHAQGSQIYLSSIAVQQLLDWAFAGSAAPRLNQLGKHVHSEYWRRQFK